MIGTNWTKNKDNYKKIKVIRKQPIVQADKTAQKLDKDLSKLHHKALCYACGQDLPKEKIEEMQRKLEEEYGEANSYVMDLQEQIDQTDKELQELGDLTEKPDTYYDTIKEAYEHKQYVGNIETALKNKQKDTTYIDQIDELQKQALQEINWDEANTLQKLKEHPRILYKLLTNKDSYKEKKIIDQINIPEQ